MAQNYGLGRGLSSLIPNKRQDDEGNLSQKTDSKIFSGSEDSIRGDKYVLEIDTDNIVKNPHQPRFNFDQDKLGELAASIKQHGIVQPLIVSHNGRNYELIAGERRLQAAKIAGLKKVPAIVRNADEKEKLELAVIENIQRHDLNPIEEAKSYKRLFDDYQMSQEEISQKIGKSRSLVANKIRLLSLPVEIQKALIDGRITEGHAKAILSVSSEEKQRALFEMILKSKLTVRQVEDKTKEISVRSHKRAVSVDPETKELEDKLVSYFGTKVKVKKSGGGGKIIVDYYSKEELNAILDKLSM